ncbi:MFS transporter [Streptomyces sp. BH104]|uniref:MFS transporter n=1 Tax=Streptomyces sp. BH104 TaxID=3410407 RepID=UPI003BB78457
MRMPGRRTADSSNPIPRIPLKARLRAACAPLAVRPFRLHYAARLCSWTGSAVAPIGLAFAVLHLGAGASGLGLVLAAGVIPQILLLLVGGVVADRFSRDRVMVWTNVVSAAAEAAAAALLWTGHAQVWHLVVMSAACGAASAFFNPAAGGIVVEVVPADMRRQANALLKLSQNLVKIGGPAIGGALVAAAGASWVIAWDSVTFVAAAVLCARIALPPARVKVKAGILSDLREGWTGFRSRRWLWIMVVQGAVVVPAWLVGYQLLGPVYGKQYLGGAAPWGVVVAAFSGGLVLGAAVALMTAIRRVGITVCLGTGAMALPLAAMAAHLPLPVLAAATGTAGTGLALSMSVWASLVQERIARDQLGRITSYSVLGQTLPVPVGYLAAGPVANALGVRTALAAAAAVIVAATVIPLLLAQIRALVLAPDVAAADDALVVAPR